MSWGANKAKLKFDCQHDPVHVMETNWSKVATSTFSHTVDSVKIIERTVYQSFWQEACDIHVEYDDFLVIQNADAFTLTIVGYDCETLSKCVDRIDGIKPPPVKDTTVKKVTDDYQLVAFEKFGFSRELASKFDIDIDVDITNHQLKVTGVKESVEKALDEITEALLKVSVKRYPIGSKEIANILKTQIMADEIDILMKAYDDCYAKVKGDTVVVLCAGAGRVVDDIYKAVISLVQKEELKLEGSAESKQDELEIKIQEVASKFGPLLHLCYETHKSHVSVTFTCPKEYVGIVSDEIQSKLVPCLVRKERVLVAPFFVDKLFKSKYIDALEDKMRLMEIDQKENLIIDKDGKELNVFGNFDIRENVKLVVKHFTEKINVSWIEAEEHGIDVFFDQGENREWLKELQVIHNCFIHTATKNEMKGRNIHCIALLETGQAILTGTADLTRPNFAVDAIVNIVDEKLEHKGELAKRIINKGGRAIQNACRRYILEHGELPEGEVFVSTAGNLNPLKILHAVRPMRARGSANEKRILTEIITNVLKAMVKEECVLRSVGFPVIGNGSFSFPRNEIAKIVLRTLKTKLVDFKSIREVFFYDVNAAAVREMQEQMEKIFGKSCFHLPVENIRVGKGIMANNSSDKLKVERKGTRTVPLPGKKNIIIVWGEIEKTTADVLVNTTKTAPAPSGNINDALHKAAGVLFDLNRQSGEAFGKGQVPDGTLVSTKAGYLPCNNIYHIKLGTWDKHAGEKNVGVYTRTCLHEALRCNIRSIAFPTIGTYDMGYDQDTVARAMVRTVGEFMKQHINSSLETIKIVIFKTDVACSTAFEKVIEHMFRQRPHRLEVVIQETSENKSQTEESDGDNNAHNERNTQVQCNKRIYRINHMAKLELETGYIEKSKADVIVCTSSTFPSLHGEISSAIKHAGGNEIESHIKNKYQEYPADSIATAPGSRLQCQKIYVLKLDEYKRPEQGQKVYDYVISCLEKANSDKFGSIAFPTIGTGGFKYPDVLVANKMFEAIRDFNRRPFTCVNTIKIIMFARVPMVLQTFPRETVVYFGKQDGQPLQQQESTNDDTAPVSSQDSWRVPNSNTKVEISYGNLENAQADVILNTTTSFPNLNGEIPSSLIRVAGSDLQNECLNFPNKVLIGDIAATEGYNLRCQKVFHFVLPQWGSSDKQRMIRTKMSNCFHMMKNLGLHSIAIPSIGTGGYRYDSHMVANGVYDAARRFGETSPDYSCTITLVLCPLTTDVNKVFADVMKQRRSNKRHLKYEYEDDNYDNEENMGDDQARKVKDFVLFQIVSDNPDEEKRAVSDIRRIIEDNTKSVDIELMKDKTFDYRTILDQEANKKMLLEIGEGYTSNVKIESQLTKIQLRGMGENVKKCHAKILDTIRELRSYERQKKVGNVMQMYVEWYYTEDDGRIWVPYPIHIAFVLEDAYKQKENKKEFKDTDGKHYVVDLANMSEDIKDSTDNKKSVKVIRRQLNRGNIVQLPGFWAIMASDENVKEVELQPADVEYNDVEKRFKNTLGGFQLRQIAKIIRIQNTTLFQQYAIQKKQFETDLKGVNDIERILWHGVKEEAEVLITSKGFDRGNAGQTFDGKVWYGKGTYFAVNSTYSTSDNYSPAGQDGCKRMYMVKVLTGQTTAVAQGYSERCPPLLPTSQTDRYNSVCDDINNPKEFVIFSDTQAYPEYMIYFN